jgi:hypothetical protein
LKTECEEKVERFRSGTETVNEEEDDCTCIALSELGDELEIINVVESHLRLESGDVIERKLK